MKDKNNLPGNKPQMRGGDPHKPKLITTHTAKEGQTLSDIALQYYKHGTPPYWGYLLEHNKGFLKGDEKNLRPGMYLEIPELPNDLKE